MSFLDPLIQPSPTFGDGSTTTLDVSGASEAQALGALASTFGADDDCTELRVLRDGKLLGTVRRDAALAVIGDGVKGFGSSDGLHLPGVANYSTTNWVCPRAGCGYTLVTILLGDPPHCGRHPDQVLSMQT